MKTTKTLWNKLFLFGLPLSLGSADTEQRFYPLERLKIKIGRREHETREGEI